MVKHSATTFIIHVIWYSISYDIAIHRAHTRTLRFLVDFTLLQHNSKSFVKKHEKISSHFGLTKTECQQHYY